MCLEQSAVLSSSHILSALFYEDVFEADMRREKCDLLPKTSHNNVLKHEYKCDKRLGDAASFLHSFVFNNLIDYLVVSLVVNSLFNLTVSSSMAPKPTHERGSTEVEGY